MMIIKCVNNLAAFSIEILVTSLYQEGFAIGYWYSSYSGSSMPRAPRDEQSFHVPLSVSHDRGLRSSLAL